LATGGARGERSRICVSEGGEQAKSGKESGDIHNDIEYIDKICMDIYNEE
jgi:hypothetical protein